MGANVERGEWIGDKVQVRLLNRDEYARLVPFFLNNEASMPSAESSQIAVAEDQNGDIVGFFVLQLVAHAEPIWVAEDYQHRGVAKLLIDQINQIADSLGMSYYSFAESQRVEALCQENAMQSLPYRVYLRQPTPK